MRIRLLTIVLAAFAWQAQLPGDAIEDLRAGFANPPRQARVHCYWWWLNGHTDKAAITRDLEEMAAKGYGGALLVDANGSDQFKNRMVEAGPMFGSPEWRELYRHAIKEAARLNLEISLNIASGWNLGGPSISPEQASKLLTYSRLTVHGGEKLNQRLEAPAMVNGFYRDIAVLAYPLKHGSPLPTPIQLLKEKAAFKEYGRSMPITTPLLNDVPATPGEEDARSNQVIDVTARRSADGRLQWVVPAGGDWEILRIGYTDSGAKVSTSSGKWQGLALDHLDHQVFEDYWRQNVKPLIEDARPYIGKSLRYLVTDSWELGGTNWTGRFREQFQAHRGYDLLPYLPIVAGRIIDSRDDSNRFLNDLRKTIGELIADEHYGTFARLAAQEGLGIHPESGGPHGAPIDALRNLGKSTFPQTEFWAQSATHRSTDEDRFFVKEGSSAAHIYGKTIVAAEGMTSIGPQWEETIWNNLKPTFDQAVCAGVNLLFWHTFTSSPKSEGLPGQEYFAGTHLNPNVTWWPYAGPFLRYISRIQFLMQQGLPVADVLYYYGDQAPNFVQLKAHDPANILPGYDYDVTDEEALLHRLETDNGRLVFPDGMSYRMLVMPDIPTISAAALAQIAKLKQQGAVVTGPMPTGATGLHQDITALSQISWDKSSARETLNALHVDADFSYEGTGAKLDYAHRQTPTTEIYFVRSASLEAASVAATFRISSAAPEEWDAATGEVRPLAVYHEHDHLTTIPLLFGPYGSKVIVFRKGVHTDHFDKIDGPVRLTRSGAKWEAEADAPGRYMATSSNGEALQLNLSASAEPLTIKGPWEVHFDEGWGAPASAAFEKLVSWTENADPSIRYFSGSASYATSFDLGQSLVDAKSILLDLGDVRELAEVTLNGHNLGVIWQYPRTVQVKGFLRLQHNELTVRVVNFWPNRLIGDQRLPIDQRRTHTNILKFTADSPLRLSGLLGPVVLRPLATN